jgi:hypothetical protein
MRESARECQYTLYARQSDRYKSVYSACRGENTVCTLIAYRAAEFGDLFRSARAENGKYEERQTIPPAPVPAGVELRRPSKSNQSSLASSRGGPLTRDNAAPTKESNLHLRYYDITILRYYDIPIRIIHPAGIHRRFIHRAFHSTTTTLTIIDD